MKKVAIFGNAGAGKSTLARRLADLTGLPLHPLDLIAFRPDGSEVAPEDYTRAHDEILARDAWIMEGYGSRETLWPRLDAADTLVYIDLPVHQHYRWVLKRLLKGNFSTPEGWHVGSPIWKGSLGSLRVISLCHRYLTPKYRAYVTQAALAPQAAQGPQARRVYHLKSAAQMAAMLREVEAEVKADAEADARGRARPQSAS